MRSMSESSHHQPHGEYEVESLSDHRKTLNGHLEMLVKWKGYPEEDSTWEPVENVHPELLVDYFQTKLESEKKHNRKRLGTSNLQNKEREIIRQKLADANKQLERAEKMCQNLSAQNDELKMTIDELVDENRGLKANKLNDEGKKLKTERENAKLLKEIASLRSALRQTRQRLHKQIDEARQTSAQERKRQESLVRKIEQGISSITSEQPNYESDENGRAAENKEPLSLETKVAVSTSASMKRRKLDVIQDPETTDKGDLFATQRPIQEEFGDPAFF